eukprot:13883241-Alexandrium_andersonii.AAC.1
MEFDFAGLPVPHPLGVQRPFTSRSCRPSRRRVVSFRTKQKQDRKDLYAVSKDFYAVSMEANLNRPTK